MRDTGFFRTNSPRYTLKPWLEVQAVKAALVGAGCVEACMHVLSRRCSDLSQGVVKHGDRSLQATASLLQDLVTEQPAKQLAFKYGACRLDLELMRNERMGDELTPPFRHARLILLARLMMSRFSRQY